MEFLEHHSNIRSYARGKNAAHLHSKAIKVAGHVDTTTRSPSIEVAHTEDKITQVDGALGGAWHDDALALERGWRANAHVREAHVLAVDHVQSLSHKRHPTAILQT